MNKILSLTDEEYFARQEISNSFLQDFDRSPAHAFTDRKQTASMRTGSIIHKYILTPKEFKDEYVIAPPEIPNDKRKKEYKEFASKQTKEILFQSNIEELDKIKHNVMSHKYNGQSIESFLVPAINEVTMLWEMNVNNKSVACKGKADAIFIDNNNAIIFDLKKVQNCLDFHKSAINYKYYRQAAFYTVGLRLISPEIKDLRFVFITVEEKAPYGVMTYELDMDFMTQGRAENYKSIINYLSWNGDKSKIYDDTTVMLQRPDWLAA